MNKGLGQVLSIKHMPGQFFLLRRNFKCLSKLLFQLRKWLFKIFEFGKYLILKKYLDLRSKKFKIDRLLSEAD